MLSKSIRIINQANSVELINNKTYTGKLRIDRKMNIITDESIIKAKYIRYILISNEELTKILNTISNK
ncbi:hypothetical protein NEIRO03_2141 [Nematocida sp. AWRm78]|nr:hypothetical protein NEIRO02_2106 [Nematocida sp. AWRm79]KAI5185910.1 hypothetical protein NEIRO03_2141 [Nematocida sp. AWRm78]